jgi:hypothetical protein
MLLNPLEIDFFGESSLTNLIKRTSLIIIKTMNIEENKIKIISLGILAKFVVTETFVLPPLERKRRWLGERRQLLRFLCLQHEIDGSSTPLLTAPAAGGGGDLGPELGAVSRSLQLEFDQPAVMLWLLL